MTNVGRIRKQIYELTLADFERSPVWEFANDEEGIEGQDEATVRPYSGPIPVGPDYGGAIVSAHFNLADGTGLRGYLTPSYREMTGLGFIQPAIICDSGQIHFWFGVLRPPKEEIDNLLEKLGRKHHQVFPIEFSSEVEIVDGPVTGIIPGFLFMDTKHELVLLADGSTKVYKVRNSL